MAWSSDVSRTGSSRRALMAASFRDPARLGFSDDEGEGDSGPKFWAELERLPTPERAKRGILLEVDGEEKLVGSRVDIRHLTARERKVLLERVLEEVDEDNEQFLRMIRNRYERVGLELPNIEVRFENLSVEGDFYVGSRALPTLFNAAMNAVEGMARHVGIRPSKKKVHQILHSLSGIITPSRMTLLLGPPSSGKTTMLRALAGMLDKDLRMSGKITYCGRELSEFVPQRTSSYTNQHDIHISEMTVRETLDFSRQCSGVGNSYHMLLELLRREKDAGLKPDTDIDAFMKEIAMEGQRTSLITDYILTMLGLDTCADTIVGDAMKRGISGGQKKRVTTGEMLTRPMRTLFMDDISTGLDSSTTIQIVKFIGQMVHVMEATVLMSLLQPPPEVFDLFDDIILLSEGHIVYHGPREHVLEFFESMGFKCPERKAVADFLQEVTSKMDQEKYWFREAQQFRHIPALEFVNSFKSFHAGRRISESLRLPYDASRDHHDALSTNKYGISSWELFKASFSREWLLMKRNSAVYVFKIIQITIMSLIAMSVFFRTQMSHGTIADGAKYFNALFYGLLNVMFNGMSEIAMTIERLPVFYKQRDFHYYPPWAFGLPYIVLRIPVSLLESGIWIAFTYYLIGFAPAASRFFGQLLAFFLVHHMSYSLCRFIAATGRTVITSNTYGTFFFLVVFVLGGFIVSKDDVKPWWSWARWISPMSYGQYAIAINEFLDPRWSTPNNDTSINEPTIGKAILKSRGTYTDGYWYWISVGAIAGFSTLFNACFILALRYLDAPASFHVVVEQNVEPEKKKNEDFTKSNERLGHKKAKKSAASSPTIISGQMGSRGMVLPFQPHSLTFSHVNYYIDVPNETKNGASKGNRLQLLRDVSGAFRPGVLTALVGVSGAGKTTLMDVLAGRKTRGYIEGSIKVSGYPKNQATFARVSGYCEQNDIHSPYVTVSESLLYSAWLRLAPEIKAETRKAFVEEIMELVELNLVRNALVGSPGVDGLSTEQRKRLTIAVELVSNPSIIFMDEPTSGLDARSAAIVMRTVRNTVDTGRTVVCTIHQPSIDIFESFDELLLMKNGGRLIYAGPLGQSSHNLIEYFEAIPGVPKIRSGQNPATWVLEISSPSMEANLNVDFGNTYSSSSLCKRNEELIKELSTPAPDSKDLSFPTKYSQSFGVQCIACFWKQRQSYWRNPDYNCTRFFMTLVFGLMFGTILWNKSGKIAKEQDLLDLLGGIYAAVFFLGQTIGSLVQPILVTERTVFYRERAAGMYSSLSYALAQVAIEVVYAAVFGVLYAVLLFSMLGFGWQADKFFWFLYFTFMCFISFLLFGMMIASLTPNLAIATILLGFFSSFWNLFSGFIVPRSMSPIWWRWYYWTCPVFWTIYGVVVSQVGDKENLVEMPGQSDLTVKALLKELLGFEQSLLGYIAAIHVGYVLIFFFGFVFSIKFFNYQNR